MFTVQKMRVLFLSDFKSRIGGSTVDRGTAAIASSLSGIDNPIDIDVSVDALTALRQALVIFVSTTLGKGNEKEEVGIWANKIIQDLSQETQALVLSIVLRDTDGKINGYIWNGEIKEALELSLPKYM